MVKIRNQRSVEELEITTMHMEMLPERWIHKRQGAAPDVSAMICAAVRGVAAGGAGGGAVDCLDGVDGRLAGLLPVAAATTCAASQKDFNPLGKVLFAGFDWFRIEQRSQQVTHNKNFFRFDHQQQQPPADAFAMMFATVQIRNHRN
mmetsp:Transcript_24926/g.51803  ORF Transcript_24926/g.51803 Transcript_24926/m.51803 type:complete len:147 (-) Transcript_24926:15-455(-)